MATTARALAALGHDMRLSIFRLLVKAGHDGLNIGEVGAHLGARPSTLAFHLSTLVEAGLVRQEKRGRAVVNHVDFDALRGAMEFLTSECCMGVLTLVEPDAA